MPTHLVRLHDWHRVAEYLTRYGIIIMNNQLIPVFSGELSGVPAQLVDARLLHTFLESAQDFSDWIKKRIKAYSFIENTDYLIHKFMEQLPSGAKAKIDYHLSIDMAKELGMIERSEKGRQIRRYFLEMERKALQLSSTTSQLPDPKTKLALPGGLTLDMQDTIKAMVKANAAILPKEKQAGAIIRQWSAIKKKFGCSYKEVSPDNYINILSLLSRLPLEGEVLPKEVLPKETNPLLTDNAYRNEARLAFDDYLEFCNATMRQAGVKPPEQWPVIDSKTVDGLVASMMWNSQWVMSFDPGTMQPSIRSIPFDALLMPETKAIDYLTKQRGYIVMKESELLSKIRS